MRYRALAANILSERFSNIAGKELKGAVGRKDPALYRPAGTEVSENYNLIQAATRVPRF
jgi:hypothetical protein